MPTIQTENLLLLTFTAKAMLAVLSGETTLEIDGNNYRLAKQWPIDVYRNLFPYKISRFQNHPEEEQFEGVIILKSEQLIIGDMGFKGGPDQNGVMDIGYSIVPEYQGKGYATEMGIAMCEWGSKKNGVNKIAATCSIYNYPSIRVLEKIGMKQVKMDMEKYYWEYHPK